MLNPLSNPPLQEPLEVGAGVGHVVSQRRLGRLLAFAGRSIDDVVNCGVAKRELVHYFKTDGAIARRCQVLELEAQWNPLRRMG